MGEALLDMSFAGVSFAMDLWALGCIIFQMLAGRPPFKGENEYLTFQLVTSCDFEFPEHFDANAKDLVTKLLQSEPEDRLGRPQITLIFLLNW